MQLEVVVGRIETPESDSQTLESKTSSPQSKSHNKIVPDSALCPSIPVDNLQISDVPTECSDVVAG